MSCAVARILPIAEEHIDGFRTAVDSVARERRYLARFEVPPEADTRKYVLENIARHAPHFVAIADSRVVGWCDIALKPQAAFAQLTKCLKRFLVLTETSQVFTPKSRAIRQPGEPVHQVLRPIVQALERTQPQESVASYGRGDRMLKLVIQQLLRTDGR